MWNSTRKFCIPILYKQYFLALIYVLKVIRLVSNIESGVLSFLLLHKYANNNNYALYYD